MRALSLPRHHVPGVAELAVVQLEQPGLPSLAPAVADDRQAQLAALQAQLPALSVGGGGGSSSAVGGGGSADAAVIFLANSGGSISYACCFGDGAVHIIRGERGRRWCACQMQRACAVAIAANVCLSAAAAAL